MLVQLGQVLITHLGYQADATVSTFERARDLAETVADPALLLPANFGQWGGRYVRCTSSKGLADRLYDLTGPPLEPGPRCVALRLLALERFHEGRYGLSLDLVGQALAAYDPTRHRDLGLVYATDPRATATVYEA